MSLLGRALVGTGSAAAALALNRVLVDRETRPAQADGGYLVGVPAGELHVVDEGDPDAPPTVLLHGFAGSLRWFDRLAPLLARERRAIRLDLLGHGGSTKPRTGYSIEAQAEAVELALARLGVERAAFVGHAMGAAVAVALAERGGELVERIAILDEAPDNDFGDQPLIAKLGFVPVLGEAIHRVVTDGMVRDGYADAFGEEFDLATGFDDPDQVVRDFRSMTYASYSGCWDAEDAFLAATPLDERLRRLDLPALVVFGEQDRFFRAQESADAFRRVPRARVETIPGCGHSPAVERPAELAPLVLELVATAAG
ncbi:MAG TPA: alpha/beta fold hydrolase [Thermoleophilaceae bacterium]|jgi:pimeloyl-ACP methyl ester carboxylesterase